MLNPDENACDICGKEMGEIRGLSPSLEGPRKFHSACSPSELPSLEDALFEWDLPKLREAAMKVKEAEYVHIPGEPKQFAVFHDDEAKEPVCSHSHMGQLYDERRGCGNGPVKCLNCRKTLRELLDEARRETLDKVESYVESQKPIKDSPQTIWIDQLLSIIPKLKGN